MNLSGGRNGKRRQHGSRNNGSLDSQGKHGLTPELQGTDANADRRGPRRHSNGKGFSWKKVGFSECSKTCAGGNLSYFTFFFVPFHGRFFYSPEVLI